MPAGFLRELVERVGCPVDGAALLAGGSSSPFITRGIARCRACGRQYPIQDGVLRLLDGAEDLHPQSAYEMRKRDARSEEVERSGRGDWTSRFAEAGELMPTLAALDVRTGLNVAELGCGRGRYTGRLLAGGATVAAIDFSLASLLALGRRLPASARVGLVCADVSRPFLSSRAFDRVLSTLHSNLPTAEHRARCLQHVATGLNDDGLAIISMHHFGLREWLAREPQEGAYPDSGIYRCHLRQNEAAREARRYFERVRFVYIHTSVPGIPSVALARLIAGLPVARSALGRLFLAVVAGPRREPEALAGV